MVRLSSFLAVSLAALLAAFATSQEPRPGGGGSRRRDGAVKAHSVIFPTLSTTVPIGVILPNKAMFIEMGAYAAELTPAVVPGLKKKSVPAVQLVYGYKKGGIGCVYEMPFQAGLDPLKSWQTVLKSGTFKDRQYFKGWVIKAVPDKKLLIAVSGTSPEVQAALAAALKR